MTTNLIFAPHADDEIIGCWTLLEIPGTTVAYCSELDTIRRHEAEVASKAFGFIMSKKRGSLPSFIGSLVNALHRGATCWAPDPHWELHPLHKIVGTLVRDVCERLNVPFGTYSTSMNVPYLRTLNEMAVNSKRIALKQYYPSQQTLWQYDHKYFLFEGMALWNPHDDSY